MNFYINDRFIINYYHGKNEKRCGHLLYNQVNKKFYFLSSSLSMIPVPNFNVSSSSSSSKIVNNIEPGAWLIDNFLCKFNFLEMVEKSCFYFVSF